MELLRFSRGVFLPPKRKKFQNAIPQTLTASISSNERSGTSLRMRESGTNLLEDDIAEQRGQKDSSAKTERFQEPVQPTKQDHPKDSAARVPNKELVRSDIDGQNQKIIYCCGTIVGTSKSSNEKIELRFRRKPIAAKLMKDDDIAEQIGQKGSSVKKGFQEPVQPTKQDDPKDSAALVSNKELVRSDIGGQDQKIIKWSENREELGSFIAPSMLRANPGSQENIRVLINNTVNATGVTNGAINVYLTNYDVHIDKVNLELNNYVTR